MENYVYLVIFVLREGETRGSGSIYKEGFIKRDEVEQKIKELENEFMEDFDGYEIFEPLHVMQEGGICNFNL